MRIHIDFNSDEAIYIQLRNQIVLGIAREQLHDGESLPSVRQLAEELGVNMHTVNKAYAMLRQEGYLLMDRRRGAVVHIEVQNQPMDSLNMAMKLMVAEAICRDIAVEELQQIIHDMYLEFDD
ncbi:MAG: GntR family transcriptional regulator [Lachnospira sp.]|nr:GntR family transcriptional regulator [Lachnospira sp.]